MDWFNDSEKEEILRKGHSFLTKEESLELTVGVNKTCKFIVEELSKHALSSGGFKKEMELMKPEDWLTYFQLATIATLHSEGMLDIKGMEGKYKNPNSPFGKNLL